MIWDAMMFMWPHCNAHYCHLRAVTTWAVCPKCVLNWNIGKSRLPIIHHSIVKLFWNFAQSTTVSPPCSVQNFKMIWQPKSIFWTNEISWTFEFKMHFGQIAYFATAHERHAARLIHIIWWLRKIDVFGWVYGIQWYKMVHPVTVCYPWNHLTARHHDLCEVSDTVHFWGVRIRFMPQYGRTEIEIAFSFFSIF